MNEAELFAREGEMMKEVRRCACLLRTDPCARWRCSQIHRIVTTCLGSPPEQITFEYYDSSKQYQKIGPISPIEFYRQIIKPVFNVDSKVRS